MKADAASVRVNVDNPLQTPYRTGSYLTYDVKPGTGTEFRSGMSDRLDEHRYRASGSHQLNFTEFAGTLSEVIDDHDPSTIHLVDLREETHGFFDLLLGTQQRVGVAVSWYADNDFGNVGQSWPWIVADEAARLATAKKLRAAQVFAIQADDADNRDQQRMMPTGYEEVRVHDAYSEAELVAQRLNSSGTSLKYHRIPVTDHCAPGDAALGELRRLREEARKEPRSWVHFHCHGGDGRTTTFLALYDMLCWSDSRDPLPSTERFAARQCRLYPYCLDPDGCGSPPWKRSLDAIRWQVLGEFRDSLAAE